MEIIEISESNIENEHICCAIGNDKVNRARAEQKKKWMKDRFSEGLVFKRLNERGKVFIEYMPIESVWKPIIGKNYMVINCLWVSGKFKKNGYALELLNLCIDDAKFKGMNGIAVVTSSKVKAFLTDKKFYLKHGFETVDIAEPYFELMVLKLNEDTETPCFTPKSKMNITDNRDGFTFIFSNQCTFMEDVVNGFVDILNKKSIPNQSIKISSSHMAKEIGSPFGSLGIYYNGDFVTHELMNDKKFEELIDKLL